MNKKVKKPDLLYPFKDKNHEDASKRFDMRRMNIISDRGSRVELVQTIYAGGIRKLELKETLYLKKEEGGKKLGEILYLRPYDQVRLKKHLDFVANINKNGEMFITREGTVGKIAQFNNDQRALIMCFYESKNISLNNALALIKNRTRRGYTTPESLRATIIKINRKIIGIFKLTQKDKFISGKTRHAYSFNPNIRLKIIDDRLMSY